jgi:hypothetical protein
LPSSLELLRAASPRAGRRVSLCSSRSLDDEAPLVPASSDLRRVAAHSLSSSNCGKARCHHSPDLRLVAIVGSNFVPGQLWSALRRERTGRYDRPALRSFLILKMFVSRFLTGARYREGWFGPVFHVGDGQADTSLGLLCHNVGVRTAFPSRLSLFFRTHSEGLRNGRPATGASVTPGPRCAAKWGRPFRSCG